MRHHIFYSRLSVSKSIFMFPRVIIFLLFSWRPPSCGGSGQLPSLPSLKSGPRPNSAYAMANDVCQCQSTAVNAKHCTEHSQWVSSLHPFFIHYQTPAQPTYTRLCYKFSTLGFLEIVGVPLPSKTLNANSLKQRYSDWRNTFLAATFL